MILIDIVLVVVIIIFIWAVLFDNSYPIPLKSLNHWGPLNEARNQSGCNAQVPQRHRHG